MKRALIPGSFDPVTNGHLDIILRAARVFDEVYVVIFDNCEKKGRFELPVRLRMLEEACAPYSGKEGNGRIITDSDRGLLADYAAAHSMDAVIKGARNATDFDYEYWLSLINRSFDPAFETIILPARAEYQHISSTVVRELLKYGKSVRGYVPDAAADIIEKL